MNHIPNIWKMIHIIFYSFTFTVKFCKYVLNDELTSSLKPFVAFKSTVISTFSLYVCVIIILLSTQIFETKPQNSTSL